jgi:hypothetical protein
MKRTLLFLFLGMIILSALSCGGDSDFWWDSNFYIYNHTTSSLDIWVDGTYYFTLAPGTANTIESVPPGFHLLEAYITVTGPLYEWWEADNSFDEDIHWHIY